MMGAVTILLKQILALTALPHCKQVNVCHQGETALSYFQIHVAMDVKTVFVSSFINQVIDRCDG